MPVYPGARCIVGNPSLTLPFLRLPQTPAPAAAGKASRVGEVSAVIRPLQPQPNVCHPERAQRVEGSAVAVRYFRIRRYSNIPKFCNKGTTSVGPHDAPKTSGL